MASKLTAGHSDPSLYDNPLYGLLVGKRLMQDPWIQRAIALLEARKSEVPVQGWPQRMPER